MEVKQVIVIRKDLHMRRGKECTQASHAAMAWLTDFWRRGLLDTLTPEQRQWLNGSFTKIVVQVDSEAELMVVFNKAKEEHITAYLITDHGKTEFSEPTITCCAIGPDYADTLNLITGHLKLY